MKKLFSVLINGVKKGWNIFSDQKITEGERLEIKTTINTMPVGHKIAYAIGVVLGIIGAVITFKVVAYLISRLGGK